MDLGYTVPAYFGTHSTESNTNKKEFAENILYLLPESAE